MFLDQIKKQFPGWVLAVHDVSRPKAGLAGWWPLLLFNLSEPPQEFHIACIRRWLETGPLKNNLKVVGLFADHAYSDRLFADGSKRRW